MEALFFTVLMIKYCECAAQDLVYAYFFTAGDTTQTPGPSLLHNI